MRPSAIAQLARAENLLVLATRPGEEASLTGALIAEACARGRPPLVAVLMDGSGGAGDAEAARRAAAAERAVRASVAALGLPRERLFLFGLHDGTLPDAPAAVQQAVVRAIGFLMWSRDCGALVAPPAAHPSADHAAAGRIAAQVAAGTGVGLVTCPGDAALLPLEGARAAARGAALACLAAAGLAPALSGEDPHESYGLDAGLTARFGREP